jgi:putative oxidoreductase
MSAFVATPIDPLRLQRSLTVLRWLLAGLIAIHGWFRFLSGGYAPFGEFLTLQGFPLGGWIAIAVTAYEIIGTPLLAMGRAVLPLCLGYVGIYLMGIALVHYPAGWFVVGAGRNGMEYSVLLIACLLLVAWQYLPVRRS